MGNKKNERVGEIVSTKNYGDVEILEYIWHNNCTIRFINSGAVLYNQRYSDLKEVKDPYTPKISGVGYFGVGKFKAKFPDNSPTPAYTSWKGMLERCYKEKVRYMYPTYIDVYVCDEWHNYQIFCEWYYQHYKEGYQLDKDILVRGNKVYSPDTCCLVPSEINKLFTKTNAKRGEYPIGVVKRYSSYISQCTVGNRKRIRRTFKSVEEAFTDYKNTKEKWIKEVADKWKGLIDQKVYDALYSYEVLIED